LGAAAESGSPDQRDDQGGAGTSVATSVVARAAPPAPPAPADDSNMPDN
jgi:hypothetical protein